MGLARGGDLNQLLKRTGNLSEKEAKSYVMQIVLALGYLHENNIAHRDLKPENVLVNADGTLAVADFGISKEI